MNIHSFAFLIFGAALGAGLTALILPREAPLSGSSIDDAGPPSAKLTAEVERLRNRIATQDEELMQASVRAINLSNQLTALRQAARASNSHEGEAEVTQAEAEEAARREARFQARLENSVQRELREFDRITSLSPGQSLALQSLLRERQEARLAAMEARRRGEEPPSRNGPDFETRLASILTPEQLQEHRDYEDAVARSRIETGATARMNRIAPSLGLTESQKDDVFSAYYEDLQVRFLDERQVPPEERAARLTEQIEAALTPEQFAEWQALEREGRGGFRRRSF